MDLEFTKKFDIMVLYRMASSLAREYDENLCKRYLRLSSRNQNFHAFINANFRNKFLGSIHKCYEDAILDTLNYNFESKLFEKYDIEIVYGRYLFRHLRNDREIGYLFNTIYSFDKFVLRYDKIKAYMNDEINTNSKDYSKFTFIEY